MEEKNETMISPGLLWNIIKKNILFIIITVLVFGLGSFFVTKFFIPKTYTSKVSLYVDTVSTEESPYNPAQSLSMQTYAQRLVSTYIRMLDTTSFYSKVSDSLDDKYTPSELKKMISFKSDESTEVFDVVINSASPTEAKRIGDAVAEAAPETISSLKSNANLKVCDPAQIPSKHSSPNTTRNVLLFSALGLFIALMVSFIRHFADKKIKYNEEMTEILGVPILAAIPNFDSYINQKKKTKNDQGA